MPARRHRCTGSRRPAPAALVRRHTRHCRRSDEWQRCAVRRRARSSQLVARRATRTRMPRPRPTSSTSRPALLTLKVDVVDESTGARSPQCRAAQQARSSPSGASAARCRSPTRRRSCTPEMRNASNGNWTVMAPQIRATGITTRSGCCCPTAPCSRAAAGCAARALPIIPMGRSSIRLTSSTPTARVRSARRSAPLPPLAVTGQTISVTTGGPVQSFVLMRYDEATHAVDNDQRRIR